MSRLLLKDSKGKFDFSKEPDRDIKEYLSPLQDVELTLEKDTPINSDIFLLVINRSLVQKLLSIIMHIKMSLSGLNAKFSLQLN